MKQETIGTLSAVSAYVLWGFLPLYWKLLETVPSLEVLAHRVIWAAVILLFVLTFLGGHRAFIGELKAIVRNFRQAIGVFAAGVAITVNWGVYVWAVNNERVVEASLGYYINPLFSILLGMVFLSERFSRVQWLAIFFAAFGVGFMTINFGSFPWVALVLAFSFGSYGLLKKVIKIGTIVGLTVETLLVAPLVLIYLAWLYQSGGGSFTLGPTGIFLVGSGLATILPLFLFTCGAKRIPLSMIGFLQYLAPTIMLLIGVFLFNESFTGIHAITFGFIWIGLIIYTTSRFYRRTGTPAFPS